MNKTWTGQQYNESNDIKKWRIDTTITFVVAGIIWNTKAKSSKYQTKIHNNLYLWQGCVVESSICFDNRNISSTVMTDTLATGYVLYRLRLTGFSSEGIQSIEPTCWIHYEWEGCRGDNHHLGMLHPPMPSHGSSSDQRFPLAEAPQSQKDKGRGLASEEKQKFIKPNYSRIT